MHSINPATEEIIWEGAETSQQELDEIITQAKKAFSLWRRTPLEERIKLLEAFRDLLEIEQAAFIELISKEVGKPLWDAKTEVLAMIGKVALSIEAIHERCPIKEQKIVAGLLTTHHKPHGVIAVFGPFNFPGHIPNGHIVPALLAGNTVVFKPSELTPAVGKLLVHTFERAGFPKGVIQIVQGGKSVGKMFSSHPGIDGLFFTGSFETGQVLTRLFADRPGKILALELGGNNPLVLHDAEDIPRATDIIIRSAFITTGQRCTCARRLIIVDTKENRHILGEVVKAAASITIGSYEKDPFMGPLIDHKAKEALLQGQEKLLLQKGVTPLLRMQDLQQKGFFVTPAVLDVTTLSEEEDRELFGPLLKVRFVKGLQDAIFQANQTSFGLSSGLISQNPDHFRTFFEDVKAGIINWNTQLTNASSAAPFGGVGKSGNFRPSAYYAADYCSYPSVSLKN